MESESEFPISPQLKTALCFTRMFLGAVNIVICLCVIVWRVLLTQERLRTFMSRLVFCLAISVSVDQIAWFFGNPKGGTALCTIQAIWQSYFDFAVVLWSACIASVGYFMVVLSLGGTVRQEVSFALLSWGVPFVVAILPLVDSGAYGSTGEWCWITFDHRFWRLGSLYIPLGLIVAVVVGLWIRSEFKIRKISRREASGIYKRGRRRLTNTIEVIIHRSRTFLIVFVCVWLFPLAQRVVEAVTRPGMAASVSFSVLGTASLPLFSILVVFANRLADSDSIRVVSLQNFLAVNPVSPTAATAAPGSAPRKSGVSSAPLIKTDVESPHSSQTDVSTVTTIIPPPKSDPSSALTTPLIDRAPTP